ncbi:MAG: pyruvate dehydrogenase complex E1 component subunit beta [Planktomarina sp.]|nr:pyruvate dehydrogenase complex E1 component subunit beta [Planktomarina sp.]MDT2033361.1 pyruvate dehydrogenase complex E1 component subunit beta [Planktomarina sp.]MDT2039675.1 pyruvate dehydrogenase complex E1 component subunit beta [Planktomarina sp.]MDT2049356.1 pyruvate dehydrogenase complex E1 component subunit beta [Planktomarina sp.]
MAVDILMPALSPTMEEGTLTKWLVAEGDTIKSGDILAEIETDKATMEFEAVEDGIIGKLLVAEGTASVPVNSTIAVLLEDGESMSDIPAKTTVKEPINTSDKRRAEFTTPLEIPLSKTVVELKLPDGTKFKTQTVREAIRDAMSEEMRLDDTVYLIGEEVAEYEGAYKISQGMLDEFGSKRVIDTPITEHGFTGIAIGAAFGGLKPVVEFMTFNFAMQAMDQIVNSAAKTLYMSGGQMGAPMVFRGPNGAAARVGAQHSQDYAAWYSHIPGLKVVQPYSAADAKGLLKSAIRDPNPVIFLENEILYGQSFEVPDLADYTVPLGKARIWCEGDDITLVSFGIGMKYALEAAEQLTEMGVSVEVVDLRSLRPLDTQTVINSVKKTNRCVTVEEGFPVCSIGNYVSSVLMQQAFDYLDAPVINCSGKDVPMPYAANLEKLALVTTEDVMTAAKSVLYR